MDDGWAGLRGAEAENHWAWQDFACFPERFAIKDAADVILAAWVCFKHRPLTLDGVVCYKVDRIEVHPAQLRRGFGSFVMHLVGRRAFEVGADHVTGCSLPQSKGFFEKLGANFDVKKPGCAPSCSPFLLERDMLEILVGRFDGQG